MKEIDDSINWLEDPYGWWEANDEPILMAIPLQNKSAINLMAGLNDVYMAINERDLKYAKESLKALGSTIIAKATNRTNALLDLMAHQLMSDDIDEDFKKMLGEMNE
jgi:hypothetical protein